MPRTPNVPSAYQRRHLALAEQLRQVKSECATKQLQLAVFVSGVVVATISDLLQLVQKANEELERELAAHNDQAQVAVTRFQDATAVAVSSDSELEANTSLFVAAVARLQVESSWSAIDFAILRSQLIETMSLMWLEILEGLFMSDDRRVFFARVEKLVEYASSKLPVVGDALEALKTAAEVYAIRKKQAQDADAYLLSLESYCDAANVYLTSVMAFCESAERSLAGALQPTPDDVQLRIAEHIAKVSSGTHATSARREA